MKKIGTLVILLVLALLPATASASAEGGQGEKLDIPTIVLEHLADSYEWHIATYEGKHLSIPLPVIVRSEKFYVLVPCVNGFFYEYKFGFIRRPESSAIYTGI